MIVLVTGVSGVGKTTVANKLHERSELKGSLYYDADDYHDISNQHKLKNGISLTDEDRKDWLITLKGILSNIPLESTCIMACSALKRIYRDYLLSGIKHTKIHIIHLQGSIDVIFQRVNDREHQFMDKSYALLQNQFAVLEEPSIQEAFVVDVTSDSPETIVSKIVEQIGQGNVSAELKLPICYREFGIIGLGVMGQSIARNAMRKGVALSVYNRHVVGIEENVAQDFVDKYGLDTTSKVPLAFDDMLAFTKSLAKPRKIFMMINAGEAVDRCIEGMLPFLDEEDILIDGGNSDYKDTEKRYTALKKNHGIRFIGMGVSGGESGALLGPSLMPGGCRDAYNITESILKNIAASNMIIDRKTNLNREISCCAFIGSGGAGHFVKTIHNGIEYAEMQLLAEIVSMMRLCGKGNAECAEIMASWDDNGNSSCSNYLLQITIQILRRCYKKEDLGVNEGSKEGKNVLDDIIDTAGNKGTGNWATIAAAQFGEPATMMATR